MPSCDLLTRCLTLSEVLMVLRFLRPRAHYIKRDQVRSKSKAMALAVFRLACCCGLRCCEISQLRIADLTLGGIRPCIRVRHTKGNCRPHIVPLWWDKGTLEDLRRWLDYRRTIPDAEGKPCNDNSLVLLNTRGRLRGQPLNRHHLLKRWKVALLRPLGPDRQRQVSIHAGRHSFASLSLAAGRSLIEVQSALGHANVSTTSIYLHTIEREVPDVFGLMDDMTQGETLCLNSFARTAAGGTSAATRPPRKNPAPPMEILSTVRCHDEHRTGCKWRGEWPLPVVTLEPSTPIDLTDPACRARLRESWRSHEPLKMAVVAVNLDASGWAVQTRWNETRISVYAAVELYSTEQAAKEGKKNA